MSTQAVAQDAYRPPAPAGALGIEEAVRMALDGNRDLTAARLSAREAGEIVTEAWSVALPEIDVSASFTRNIAPAVSFLPAQIFDASAGPDDYLAVRFGADNQWSSTISVVQPLFKPGLLAVGGATRYEALQVETVRGQEQEVATRVRVGFYALLLAQERKRLTAESVNRVRAALKDAEARYSAGFASEYDVLRLEVELANLEPNLRRAENEVSTARRALAIELDHPDGEELAVRGSLAGINLDDLSSNSPDNRQILDFMGASPQGAPDDIVRRALELRSDVRQLFLSEEVSRKELLLERARYLPEVSLFGNYIVSAQDNGSPNFFARGDGQRAYSRLAGIRVSVPVFQGFARDARIDQKQALTRRAEALAAKGTDLARAEVRGLLESVAEARERTEGQRLAVERATRAFAIARAEYREGLSGRLDLTDAEVALRESEFNYAQAVYDYLVARAQFDLAVGRVPLVSADPDSTR